MKTGLYFAIFQESLSFAYQSIKANLLRTLLSLLGVTIGVFCIIAILTFIDSIELTIRDSVARFGNKSIFIQKSPWAFGGDYPFWKYQARPDITYNDMQQLQKRFSDAEAIAFAVWIPGKKVEASEKVVENIIVSGVTAQYDQVQNLELQAGRFFTEDEAQGGAGVVILGSDLALTLFGSAEKALGRYITLMSRKQLVAGVLKKEGAGFGGGGNDKVALIPYMFVRALGRFENMQFNPTIMVKLPENVNLEIAEDELRGVMRGIRKLPPGEEDNFALNKITALTGFLTSIFDKISLYGWVIAGFSILVGGFGIANIMFVSVKERTSIIGIQKALGAKRFFILLQFLLEAVLLCLLGGLIALVLIFLLSLLLNLVFPFPLTLTLENILIGIGISSFIGILSGYLPALQASRLDPIEAIRYGM